MPREMRNSRDGDETVASDAERLDARSDGGLHQKDRDKSDSEQTNTMMLQ